MHVVTKSSAMLYSLLLGAIYALTFSSCLPEPDRDCPPEYQITLNVKDKNYFNALNVSQISPKDESLPFSEFIGNLSYQLRNIENGQVIIDSPASSITTGDQSYTIDATGIPEGRYVFTVLGNTDETILPDSDAIELHANNQEHPDAYLAHDTLTFSATTTNHTLSMNRTKGLLLVLVENAPDSLTRVDEKIDHIGQYITPTATYSGETSISKSFVQTFSSGATLQTWVAPTVPSKKTTLRLSLFASNKAKPYSILPDIELSIKRNEISVIKVNFVPDGIEIWIYLYGTWQKLHKMDITIID